MAQSRYLFAIACFEMNLLREAETALCPINERNAEVLFSRKTSEIGTKRKIPIS